MASLTRHFAAPFKPESRYLIVLKGLVLINIIPAITRSHHIYNLLLDVQPAVPAEVGALPDLGPRVGAGGVRLAGAAHHTLRERRVRGAQPGCVSYLVPGRDVHPAVVRGAVEEHQLPLLHFLLHLPGLHGSPVSLPRDPVYPVGEEVLRSVQTPVVVVDPECPPVLLLEIFACLPELPQLPPAGLRGAAPADSVTLAESLHGLPHRNPPSLAVMEVGETTGVLPGLGRVQELPGDCLPVLDIVTAASPLPVRVRAPAASPLLTLAVLQVSMLPVLSRTQFILTAIDP